jgi:hypothetical protein
MPFVTEIKKINPKVHWKQKRPWFQPRKYEQKGKKHLRYHNIQLQTILLAQKWIWKPKEQNRRPRYESMQLHSPDFSQSCQKNTMEKRQPLEEMFLRKLKIDPYLSPCISMNSKWITDLHMRPETMTLV